MFTKDPLDPNQLAYRRLFRSIRNAIVVAVALFATVVLMGVPSIYNEEPRPLAERMASRHSAMRTKTEIHYWNPIGGRTAVPVEDVPGIPYFVWLPLRDCMDLSSCRTPLTESVLGKEFFDGP